MSHVFGEAFLLVLLLLLFATFLLFLPFHNMATNLYRSDITYLGIQLTVRLL